MLVDVPINVIELARIEAKASGMSSLLGLSWSLRLNPSTMGRNRAVAAVLLIKLLTATVTPITASSTRFGFVPASRTRNWPVYSVTPVCSSAAAMISSPSIRITTSLPNPANASSGVSSPVRTRKTTRPSPVTSTGNHSTENRKIVAAIVISSTMIWGSIDRRCPPEWNLAVCSLPEAGQNQRGGYTERCCCRYGCPYGEWAAVISENNRVASPRHRHSAEKSVGSQNVRRLSVYGDPPAGVPLVC